jgi:hypothetical protein
VAFASKAAVSNVRAFLGTSLLLASMVFGNIQTQIGPSSVPYHRYFSYVAAP